VNHSELPIQSVQQGYTIGAPPQRYAQMRHAGEGSSQPGGSRRSTPEQRSPSLPTQKDSPMTVDSDAKDRKSDKAYEPSVPSSTRGKKRRPWSMTLEHPPKVPCHGKGLSTPVQGYHGQVSGGLAAPIPTPASRLLSLNPMVPSPSVAQQPIQAPVTGTASHPMDLELPAMDLEQSTADLEQSIVGPE
jgi:hypothetical protein